MKTTHCCAILVVLLLQGCSALLPKSDFVAANPEALSEWSVEGSMEIRQDSGQLESYFEYKNIGGEYQLSLRPHSPVGEVEAVIRGVEGEAGVDIQATSAQAKEFAVAISDNLPIDNISYWLRALPATDNAKMKQGSDEIVSRIEDAGWDIQYKDYMQVSNYRLPDHITMSRKKSQVELQLVRAETGFLTSPCQQQFAGGDVASASAQPATNRGERAVETLVPRTGQPPFPRWISDQDFCAQMIKVHGKIPDPRVGLFGPGSMMWQLTGPITPGAMGSGRALLLQTAHPWVTAGIDEHSIVRYDPLERGRRTFIFISTMVYGSMPQVLAAANQVHGIHNEIKGKLPYRAGAFDKNSEYRANEVAAMIWVNATLWDTLVRMYEEIEGPLTVEDKNRFYEETKLFAMLFGIPDSALPATWDEFLDYNETMWLSPQLTVTDNARKLKEDLFNQGSIVLAFPLWVQEIVTAANLPPRIRDQYDMEFALWETLNYAWILPSAKLYNWMLPDGMRMNPVYHEARARLQGKRVGWYQRSLIKAAGVERLVN